MTGMSLTPTFHKNTKFEVLPPVKPLQKGGVEILEIQLKTNEEATEL